MYNEKREMSSFVEDYNKVTEGNHIIWCGNIIPMSFNFLKKEESVDALDLSVRSANALKRNGIKTIGQLFDNLNNLVKFRNLGRLSVKDIKTRFCEHYYDKLSPEQRQNFWAYSMKENERRRGDGNL